ncbi:hypothetical protein BDW75DRAFT_202611 [Aspergillus navahoensis]
MIYCCLLYLDHLMRWERKRRILSFHMGLGYSCLSAVVWLGPRFLQYISCAMSDDIPSNQNVPSSPFSNRSRPLRAQTMAY